MQTTLSPHNQQAIVTREYPKDVAPYIVNAVEAQKEWAKVKLDDRLAVGQAFVEEFEKLVATEGDELKKELCTQMGRPISQCGGEFNGLLERAKYMLSIAHNNLDDFDVGAKDGFKRFIKRVPVGVVFVISPWNFPYLVSINTILPALIAGNTVILKPSPQTPLVGERLASAWFAACSRPAFADIIPGDIAKGLLQTLHLTIEQTQQVVQHPEVEFVAFTGSVNVGKEIDKLAANAKGFKGVGLELGGKDPAYVRPDADLDYTVAELVDGALFNSGQSCCAIERIYAHADVYDKFVEKYAETVKGYKLGDPTLKETNLGPVFSVASANKIKKQVDDAVAKGAKALVPADSFTAAQPGTAFVAPQVLVNVDHSMDIMTEETFGPVIGIMKVSSDDEALKLMNDSHYGLTASVWTKTTSGEVIDKFINGLETGTVFLNRCDYLDPALAWTGVKDSGRGVSLSRFGYDQLTKAKSVHLKLKW